MDNTDKVTYFAATNARGTSVPFGIKQEDRSKHMYIIGKTGMGKSTMLENMAIQDIRNGEGLAFIDPHGASAERLLDYIPPHRIKDVVYFAPFDLEQPIAFNVMEDIGYDKRHLVVSGLMATFKKVWVDAWSARMEYILSNTLLALLEYPDSTLLDVNRMYTNKEYRKKVVDNVKDPLVKDFWTKEFAGYTDRYTQEATPAIQNKIGQFTNNPLIRNIIGQKTSSFNIRKMMDEKKILIVNLSKGLVGDTNMLLLGSMLTTHIFLAAMSRADSNVSVHKNVAPFFFYVDEFQNFANESFAGILSEARKYKLNLIITNQYIEQMEEQVRAAVFGNVGTTVAFRVGPFDAEVLETVFMPEFTKEDLVNLGFAHIYLSLMIDGVGSRPFSAITIPPIEPPPIVYANEVKHTSRTQFGNPREEVEGAITAIILEASREESQSSSKRSARGARGFEQTSRNGIGVKEIKKEQKETRTSSQRNNVTSVNAGVTQSFHTTTPKESGGLHTPRASQVPIPEVTPSATKEVTDASASLSDALASVTASSRDAVQKNKTHNQHILRQALSAVLERNDSSHTETSAPTPLKRVAQNNVLKHESDEKKINKQEKNEDERSSVKKPFEVSEQTLKDILHGNS